MLMFAVGAMALVLGYVFYSRVLQRILSPLRTTTPAYSQNLSRSNTASNEAADSSGPCHPHIKENSSALNFIQTIF